MLHIDRTAHSDFAWVILRDHLFHGENLDDQGTRGPRQAPADLLEALETPTDKIPAGIGVAEFKMYDDDGELYYTGRLAYRLESEGEEHVVAGPLDNFGTPNAGCVRIDYPANPRWNVG